MLDVGSQTVKTRTNTDPDNKTKSWKRQISESQRPKGDGFDTLSMGCLTGRVFIDHDWLHIMQTSTTKGFSSFSELLTLNAKERLRIKRWAFKVKHGSVCSSYSQKLNFFNITLLIGSLHFYIFIIKTIMFGVLRLKQSEKYLGPLNRTLMVLD